MAYLLFCLFIDFYTSTFRLLDKPWSQVSSLSPPGFCLQILSRIAFGSPTVRRFFIECWLIFTPRISEYFLDSPHIRVRIKGEG